MLRSSNACPTLRVEGSFGELTAVSWYSHTDLSCRITSAERQPAALGLDLLRPWKPNRRQTVTSIEDAVDSLNRRLVWCPED